MPVGTHNGGRQMHRRILLLRTDAIGDFVLFTPALASLRRLFKDDHITLMVAAGAYPLASRCPLVDEVRPVDLVQYESNEAYRRGINGQLDRAYDVAINTVYSRTAVSDRITAKTRAPVKIGFHCEDQDADRDRRMTDEVLYTTCVPTSTEWKFEVERYRDLISTLSGRDTDEPLAPVVWLNDDDRNQVNNIIRSRSTAVSNMAVIAPAAGFALKLWSAAGFARVADALIETYQMQVVFAGTAQERDLIAQILALMQHSAEDVTGQLTLPQYAALLERAGLYVGLDSAGFHLAWALGRPAVGIFGGGHAGRFIPDVAHARAVRYPIDCYRCYWNCIYEEAKCISSITPSMVLEHVASVLHALPTNERNKR